MRIRPPQSNIELSMVVHINLGDGEGLLDLKPTQITNMDSDINTPVIDQWVCDVFVL